LFSLQVPPILSLVVQGASTITLPDDVRAKLIEVLPLLNQDNNQLVLDAKPIRTIFKQIKGQLPRDLKAMMLQVAFIENLQLVVQEAQDRLGEKKHQEELTQDRENLDSSMADLENMIELFTSSRSDIVNNVDRLKRRCADLTKELDQVEQDLAAEEQKLADLPNTIATMREQRDSFSLQAQVLHEQEQPIPGSADADRQELEAVDQLCLDLINALHLLGRV
jgi:chromosome segregation ATPase